MVFLYTPSSRLPTPVYCEPRGDWHTNTRTHYCESLRRISIELRSLRLHTSPAMSFHLHTDAGGKRGLDILVSLNWLHTHKSHTRPHLISTYLGVMRVWIRKYAPKSRVQKRETQYVFIVKRCRESFKGLPNKERRYRERKSHVFVVFSKRGWRRLCEYRYLLSAKK